MAKIHSKTTLRRDRRVDKIASSLGDGAPGLAEGLSRQLGKDGWDVPRECVGQLTQSLVRVLRSRNQRLADAIYERQRIADRGKQCRLQRDAASREVYRLLVRMRRIFRAGKPSRDGADEWNDRSRAARAGMNHWNGIARAGWRRSNDWNEFSRAARKGTNHSNARVRAALIDLNG